MKMNEIFKMQPDERIVLKFRKHWWMLLSDSLGTLVVAFIPFILFAVLSAFGYVPAQLLAPAVITFVSSWWLLIVWCALAVIWTDYYLDIWIVTNHRVVNINQISLFDRQTTTWRLEKVQEVTVGVRNIFETLLGFGSLEVQTAGPTDEYAIIRGVRSPEFIQETIVREADRLVQHH